MAHASHMQDTGGWRLRLTGLLPRVAVSLAVIVAPGGSHLSAESPELAPLEYQVKAAFLMNFAKFVEWPSGVFADERSPLSVCTLGDDVFGDALDQIVAGESAHGRKLAVQRLSRPPVPPSCRLLFIGESQKDLGRVLAGLGGNVLTVGEGDRFLREGGMIAFVIDHRRVRFDINQAAAENAGLKLSSQLLRVARIVEK